MPSLSGRICICPCICVFSYLSVFVCFHVCNWFCVLRLGSHWLGLRLFKDDIFCIPNKNISVFLYFWLPVFVCFINTCSISACWFWPQPGWPGALVGVQFFCAPLADVGISQNCGTRRGRASRWGWSALRLPLGGQHGLVTLRWTRFTPDFSLSGEFGFSGEHPELSSITMHLLQRPQVWARFTRLHQFYLLLRMQIGEKLLSHALLWTQSTFIMGIRIGFRKCMKLLQKLHAFANLQLKCVSNWGGEYQHR